MKALKKGVESATGLRVSDEALFVYPEIGVWKVALEECTGDPVSGNVVMTLILTRIGEGQLMSAPCVFYDVSRVTDGPEVQYQTYSANPLHNFKNGQPVMITMPIIYDVPRDAKSLYVKFHIGHRDNMLEGRRIPISWLVQEPETVQE